MFARLQSWVALAALAGAAMTVGACGVRGPLDPPASAQQSGQAKSSEAAASGENTAAAPKPHEPFVLDGLIR
jgi:predicted small lipoprotein YifL